MPVLQLFMHQSMSPRRTQITAHQFTLHTVPIFLIMMNRRASLVYTSSLRSSRLSSSCNLAARHLERSLFLSPTRYPPRIPTLTRDSVPTLSSRRNLSIYPTPPHRAQYSRFDDDPNRPPPHSAGIQKRDIVIYTLVAGSVVYYIVQCVFIFYISSLMPRHLFFV